MSNKNLNFYFGTSTADLTHEQLKELYIEKMEAAKRHDIHFLKILHGKYPKLFDKKLLYEMLQKELQKTGKKLLPEVESLLKEAITSIKLQ